VLAGRNVFVFVVDFLLGGHVSVFVEVEQTVGDVVILKSADPSRVQSLVVQGVCDARLLA